MPVSKLRKLLEQDFGAGDLESTAIRSYRSLVEILQLHRAHSLAAYAHRRRYAVLMTQYKDMYSKERSKHPLIFIAHNSVKFDSICFLSHLAETGRLTCHKTKLVGDCVTSGIATVGGDVDLSLVRDADPMHELSCDPVKVLDVSNHCFIDLTYKGFAHFRDSGRQLPGRLAELGPSHGVETLKGCQCHKRYDDQAVAYADRGERYKPSRTLYVTDVSAGGKAENPLKHQRRTLLDKESYRIIPGNDPDGDLHGSNSKWS